MTDRADDQSPRSSLLAHFSGRVAGEVGREAAFAINDIRNAHERMWFGEAVTPGNEPTGLAQQSRFEELYGRDAAPGGDAEPSVERRVAPTSQQQRFEELYGRHAGGVESSRDDHSRTIER